MKFVCLGDSLTEGYGVRAEMCWVSLLPELTGYQWINAGISGDTTSGMLARLDRDVISRSPDGAVLMGGVNDILAAGSCSCAKTNMLAMVQQLAARQISPILAVPIPPRAGARQPWKSLSDFSQAAAETKAYAEWLRLFSADFRLRLVDFGEDLESRTEEELDRFYLPDGLHPSPEGHRIMARRMAGQKFLRLSPRRNGTN